MHQMRQKIYSHCYCIVAVKTNNIVQLFKTVEFLCCPFSDVHREMRMGPCLHPSAKIVPIALSIQGSLFVNNSNALVVWVEALRPGQQFFSHFGLLHGFNQD